MRHLMTLAVAAGLVASACSSTTSGSALEGTEIPTTAETVAADISGPAVGETDADDEVVALAGAVTEDDLARFIASAEAALTGTRHEGVVLDSAELYIALAQTSCARFSAGHSLQDIVDDLLGTPQAAADDNHLAGAILGAGVATICPDHTGKV